MANNFYELAKQGHQFRLDRKLSPLARQAKRQVTLAGCRPDEEHYLAGAGAGQTAEQRNERERNSKINDCSLAGRRQEGSQPALCLVQTTTSVQSNFRYFATTTSDLGG